MKQIKTLIVALTLIIGSQFTTAQTKVAHINVQELMTANPAMKAAEAQVKKLQETYDVEYKKMVQEYQTKLAQYEKESATVGDAVNQTRSQEMQDMGSRIQKGSTKVTLPKDQDIEKITFEEALILISNKEALGKGKKKTSEKKGATKKPAAKKKTRKTKEV